MSEYQPSELELRQAERRARLLQAANQVGHQVTSILDLDELLPKTVDIICDAYGFYYAGVFLIDPTGKWAVLRAGHGAAGAVMIAQGHKLEVGGHSMVGWAMLFRQARIALDVGEDRVHFRNPLLPHTRSEIALPLVVGDKVLGAVTVQSIEERAFTEEDVLTLQTMADHLGVAIHNAQTLQALERANQELLRAKTYEALTAATTQAIHWIGNKALPITSTVERMKADLAAGEIDRESLLEDLQLIDESARLIVEVKENLLGPVREQQPRPAMLDDVAHAAAAHTGISSAQLKVDVMRRTPLALADTTQLARALGNLFTNAIEAQATLLTLTVGPAPELGFVVLDIHDNGKGIPPDMIDNVWAAFVSTKAGHTGLGLTACLHVINQLQGRISVTSQPGAGTTFRILLPAAPDHNPPEIATDNKTVLLIDDDDRWAAFALEALKALGVTASRSLKPEGTPDLILVEEALESVPIQAIIDSFKDAGMIDKVIVVAAALKVERMTTYLQAGIRNAVLKPYTEAEFSVLLAQP